MHIAELLVLAAFFKLVIYIPIVLFVGGAKGQLVTMLLTEFLIMIIMEAY